MRKFAALLVASVLLCLTACTDDEPANIRLADKSQREQKLLADVTSAKVAFTAEQAWTASVKAPSVTRATGSGASSSWITLDKYEGEAGTVTLDITLDINSSGVSRTGTITISCGGDTIVITITQEALDAEGNVPDPDDKDNPNPPPAKTVYVQSVTRDRYWGKVKLGFGYDGLERISEITVTDMSRDVMTEKAVFDYVGDRIDFTVYYHTVEVSAGSSLVRTQADGNYIEHIGSVWLDEDGKIINGQSYENVPIDGYDSFYNWNWSTSYNTDGTLRSIEYREVTPWDVETTTYNCTWTGGNLTSVNYPSRDWSGEVVFGKGDVNKKAVNIDLFWAVLQVDDKYEELDMYGFFAIMGLYGNRTANMPQRVTDPSYTTTFEYTYNGDDYISSVYYNRGSEEGEIDIAYR